MRRSQRVFSMFFSVVFFLCFLYSSASSSSPPAVHRSQVPACDSKDRDALVRFSRSLNTGVPPWPRDASSNCCRWHGVQCGVSSSSQNSTVSESRVVRLELSGKGLKGALSGEFLLGLDALQTLNLSRNSLTGVIFPELSRLWQLEVLDLSYNVFSGQLTDEMGNLSSPIGNLSSLRYLDISNNTFSGSIPDAFHGLRTLQHFSARTNNFTGHLPASLSSCSMLTSLDLGVNSLTGRIEFDFTRLSQLRTLRLDSNRFVGRIPKILSSCRNLMFLDLAKNNLHGQIPRSFKKLQSLSSLILSDNNGLSDLPRALATLSECRNLTVLFLSGNFFREEMPNDENFMVSFERLKALGVANCSLRGSVPSWLRATARLRLLDLSSNRLAGAVPPWLGNFTNLSYLDLSNNMFDGVLPEALAHMKCLASKNCPQADKSPVSFVARSKLGRTVKTELQYVRFSSIPPTLDLSQNQINGPIVKDFGNLIELAVLDLSGNTLSGRIPEELAGMRSLQLLDLSSNNLSGTIPPSLGRLTFLSEFSVAYNHLRGAVPTSGQFSTFSNSSYEGNPGLYGTPILQPCETKSPFPQSPHVADLEGFKFTFMPLPYGIGVVIGFVPAVVGAFRCRRRKRKQRQE